MTKRKGDDEGNLNKRTKRELEGDWDDSDIDDCLIMATQICEQSVINTSKAPSYGDFLKYSENKNVCSSTQLINAKPIPARPSNNIYQSGRTHKENNDQSKKLRETIEAKEGEITILRSQMKTIKSNFEIELNKKQEDWSATVKATNQKINALKSDLEFKDLEIANLRKKLINLNKHHNLDLSFSLTQVQINDVRVADVHKSDLTSDLIYSKPVKRNPLVDSNFTNISCMGKEHYFFKSTHDDFDFYFISNLQSDSEKDLSEFEILNLNDDKCLSLYTLCKEIQTYLNYSEDKLNSEITSNVISKIISTSVFFIENLGKLLEDVQKNIQTNDVRQSDNSYLQNKLHFDLQELSVLDSGLFCDNEVGVSARQSIGLIAIIFPYNNFVRKYILEDKCLETKYLPPILRLFYEKTSQKKYYFLKQIQLILEIIGKTRKAHFFPGFLLAVINLLKAIYSYGNVSTEVEKITVSITKEIVFARPNLLILKSLSKFLQIASLNSNFVNSLCNKPVQENLKKIQNEGITYFSSKSCILQIFCTLVETTLTPKENFIDFDFFSSIVIITLNILESNSTWTFYQEKEHNDCLYKVCKIFIDFNYNILQIFSDRLKIKGDYDNFGDIIKTSLKVINMLNFHSTLDLIVKYIGSYSKYRYIVNSFLYFKEKLNLTEFEVEMLEALRTSDEDVNVITSKFENSSLWSKI